MQNFNHAKIEKKWQILWERIGVFKTSETSKKPKFYCLDMFPYPSGEGLHIGHPRGYVASDVVSHYLRRRGYNVLHPMGWDAFGLPAENYAIKTGIHPAINTRQNIKKFKQQIKALGLSYDWAREINTTDPEYYKWTQWIFLKLFEKGLAYEAFLPINFCPSCKTGLANEEVVDGRCERCGIEVVRKNLRQWVLKITSFAERLLEDLKELDWPEKIKEMQRNWIGKSEGVEIQFQIKNSENQIPVFTTRTDTLFGCTYLVLSPEYPLIEELKDRITNYKYVREYIEKAQNRSERERISDVKEKTGIEIKGISAINPVNSREIPIWVADYVLAHYGTGAIMAVPSHDQRDFDFAKAYNLPIIEVIKPPGDFNRSFDSAYEGEGILINSGRFNGLSSEVARQRIGESLEKKRLAKEEIHYKLRDWIFSRQRYWGEPIPIIHCQKCGKVPLSEKELPLKLPKVKKYQPTGTGESPLANIENWVNISCPKCGGSAKRETNTMPQWAGSCWYYLAYIIRGNEQVPRSPRPAHGRGKREEKFIWNKKAINYWLPVDLYIGGAEHAVLHLLYARFWHKFLFDLGVISFKEPFLRLRNQGLVLAPDGQKMSKSRGNVISPDSIVQKYGADTLRLYEMFVGPFGETVAWSLPGIKGCYRFLQRTWQLKEKIGTPERRNGQVGKLINKTIKKVSEDIEIFKFNTAVSSLMILVNEMEKQNRIDLQDYKSLLFLTAPFAPHLTEQLWQDLNDVKIPLKEFRIKDSIHSQPWPKYNPELVKEEIIILLIQVNGKVRDKIEVKTDISEENAKEFAISQNKIKKWIEGKKIKKVIFVPGKLINIVI